MVAFLFGYWQHDEVDQIELPHWVTGRDNTRATEEHYGQRHNQRTPTSVGSHLTWVVCDVVLVRLVLVLVLKPARAK